MDNTKKININNVATPELNEATINYSYENVSQNDVIKICYSSNKNDLFNHTNDVLAEDNCVSINYSSFINGSYTLTNLLPDVFYYCQFRINNIPYSNIYIFKTKNTIAVNNGQVNPNNIIFTVHNMDVDHISLNDINRNERTLLQLLELKQDRSFETRYKHGDPGIYNTYRELFLHQIHSKISFTIDLNLPEGVDNRLVDIQCTYTFNNVQYKGIYNGELNEKSIGDCTFNSPVTTNSNGLYNMPYTPFVAFDNAGKFDIQVQDNFGNSYSFSKNYDVKAAPNSAVQGGQCMRMSSNQNIDISNYMRNSNSNSYQQSMVVNNLYANKYFCNTASFSINKRNSTSTSLGSDYEQLAYIIVNQIPDTNNSDNSYRYAKNNDYGVLTDGTLDEEQTLYNYHYSDDRSTNGYYNNYYFYNFSKNRLSRYNSLSHSGTYIFRQDFYPDGTFSAVEFSQNLNNSSSNESYQYISVPTAPIFKKSSYNDYEYGNTSNNAIIIESYESMTLIPIKSITLTAALRQSPTTTKDFMFSNVSGSSYYVFENESLNNIIYLNLQQNNSNQYPYAYALKTPFVSSSNNEEYNNNYNSSNSSLYSELYNRLTNGNISNCNNMYDANEMMYCVKNEITISVKITDIFNRTITIM